MPATRKTTSNTRTVKALSQPVTTHDPEPQEADKDEVILRLQSILANKAPEALPLLNQLIQLLRPNPREIIESEKRARSIVIGGIAEVEGEPIEKLAHTEKETCKVLSAFGVEARPTEIYRMGDFTEGRPRLIQCVLPSERFFRQALRNAHTLRGLNGFDHVYVRRSMTREEREHEKELRRQAHELNAKQHKGNKVYVVYRNQVVKAADIPKTKASLSKNLLPSKVYRTVYVYS